MINFLWMRGELRLHAQSLYMIVLYTLCGGLSRKIFCLRHDKFQKVMYNKMQTEVAMIEMDGYFDGNTVSCHAASKCLELYACG